MVRYPLTTVGANMSLAFWADMSDAPEGVVNLVRIYNASGTELYAIDINVSALGTIGSVVVNGNTVLSEANNTDLSSNRHFTFVSTPSDTSLYVDGTIVDSGAFTHGSLTGARWLQFGADGFETPIDGGDLVIFDSRLYAKELSENAIKELWRDANSGKFGYQ